MISFYPRALRAVREIAPALQRGASLCDARELEKTAHIPAEGRPFFYDFRTGRADLRRIMVEAKPHALLPDLAILTPALVDAAHRIRLPVFTWTANTVPALRHALHCRADGVMTDDPRWARFELSAATPSPSAR